MASQDSMQEITIRGIVIGALITVVFTTSNIYLGLKVGLTFSSSIPAAVISMAVLSFFAKSNILENNMVQTQASAAGTLSSIIFMLPALVMVGYWQSFPFWKTMMICAAGGILGVVFSIPLRRTMVVNSPLPYPEGVAAAEILKAGHSDAKEDEGGARLIAFGAVVAAVVSFMTGGLRLISDQASYWFHQGKAVFQLPMGFSLALVSAGYLMGFFAGLAMLIGTVLTWAGFVPYLAADQIAGATDISEMADIAQGVWAQKVRFIGAGTLAVAAVWILITLLKPMMEGIRLSFQSFSGKNGQASVERTDLDMSSKSMLATLFAALVLLVLAFYSFVANAPVSAAWGWGLVAFGVAAAFVIGFFIAAACGYMAGLISSSNSPISGIGVIGIIAVSLMLAAITGTHAFFVTEGGKQFAMALAIFITSAIVAVASISNDNLQDLKTGYLVGATPRNQQIALIIGCVVGALVIAPVLDILYQAYGLAGAPLPREGMDANGVLFAPQATLMKTIVQGIFSHTLDWSMIVTGLIVGTVVIVVDTVLGKKHSKFRIPALAVGLGIYLPPYINVAIFIGSLLRFMIERKVRQTHGSTQAQQRSERRGILMASGLIVGESLMGVFLAIAILASLSMGLGDAPFSLDAWFSGMFGETLPLIRDLGGMANFLIICGVFFHKAAKISQ